MKKVFFIFCIFCLISVHFYGQRRDRYKFEILGGMGPTGFLGDVGGGRGNGTHLLKDYNFSSTRFNINAGIRYKRVSPFGFKAMLTYAMVSGSDALTTNEIRHNRNLNFRSPIAELSFQGEYYPLSEKRKTLYSLAGLKSKKTKKKFAPYIFVGVGLFFYNPKEELAGKWYSLRKYHVEGQGLPGGPKQYNDVSICIPMGLGFKYVVNKRWSVGAEFGLRKTFTDYIDGVSTRYYDKAKLLQAYGATAVALADPSLGIIKNATAPSADGIGAQRGNPKYKDSYMFLTINVGYKFLKQRRTRAKF
ncbi:MAG: DUF6089 family protein [Bacteroidia bacterium]